MPQRIRIESINFYADTDSFTMHGDDGGYSVQNEGAAVTFRIAEPDGGYIQMTQVVHGRARDYNEVVRMATLSLANRLKGIGALAENLEKNAAPKSE